MPVAPFSHPSSVTWGGIPIGSLVSFRASGETAETTPVETESCSVFGTGGSTRIRRKLDSTTIDPGTASVRLLGCPPYIADDVGNKQSLTITFEGGSFSGEAILISFEVEGSVGELLRGSAEFAFTGA